jgi:predicted glycosyltransferase involved in capsule biosynthesis
MDNLTDLLDVTIIFPVRLDSIERLENTLVATQFLVSSFETNLMVSEYSSFNNCLLERLLGKSIQYTFHEDHDPILFRTKFLNEMTQSVTTPFVAIWDTDVIVPKNQVFKAMEMLRNGEADFVYPYESYFFDTTPLLRKLYFEGMDIMVLEQNTKKMKAMYPPNPVGGAFMANRRAYVDAGLENENFYGWGLEDGERYYRWLNLGYKVKRVPGPLFHLSHGRGINSTYGNPDQQLVKRKEVIREKRNTFVFQ